MAKLLGRKQALERLNIHQSTLYSLVEKKEIEAIKLGNKYLYNVDKYLQDNNITVDINAPKIKRRVCYCRVSSNHQKEDLERQIELVQQYYPNHEIISDIGSGLNFKRKGFLKLINYAIKGEINELVVVYKDRLCRFGFELVEYMIETFSAGKIIIMNRIEEKTPAEEISEDILAIMNIYVAKMNGLRKYKKQIKKDLTGISDSDSE